MTEYVKRPEWNYYIKGKRAQVWHWRYVSAWDLASIKCGNEVTQEEYENALELLDSVQRYALADAAEWERENSSEWYCNSEHHKQREKQLNKRRERLQERLKAYGLKMENYGLYPTIIDIKTKESKHFLHYFD